MLIKRVPVYVYSAENCSFFRSSFSVSALRSRLFDPCVGNFVLRKSDKGTVLTAVVQGTLSESSRPFLQRTIYLTGRYWQRI